VGSGIGDTGGTVSAVTQLAAGFLGDAVGAGDPPLRVARVGRTARLVAQPRTPATADPRALEVPRATGK